MAASALGLTGTAYSLDAACASSLYAIKLACDQLQDRRSDLMIAGAVNRADDLFIKIGFCALSAMSRAGVSRPFDKKADGLLPAEGAAFIVLKRLSDAKRDNDNVLGVIRGIGLSNDGRSGGFLAPSKDGQIRAMRSAYEQSGIAPESVSLLECHATGTPVGDKVEIESSSEIFAGCSNMPIGSLKSNMGHLITVAGLAGMLKILGSFEHKTRPPSLNVDDALDIFNDSPFRVLGSAESWDCDGPRRAALSAFGFGGNNAHVIVEEWNPEAVVSVSDIEMSPKLPNDSVAIVAIEARLPGAKPEGMDWNEFEDSLFKDVTETYGELGELKMQGKGLRFPPNDLDHCLPQQLLMLELARRVADKVPSFSQLTTRSSVLIGMGVDPEISRYAARWRVSDRLRNSGKDLPDAIVQEAQDAFVHGLEAAGVIGTMPNIPANRVNSQLNLQGPSYTVASEELSGLRALEIAERALREGEIDAAIVGAVDFSAELVHKKAMALFPNLALPSDGGVAFVLKRVSDAKRDGDTILSTLSQRGVEEAGEELPNIDARIGHSHASYGLMNLAAAVSASYRSFQIDDAGSAVVPLLGADPRSIDVSIAGMGDQESQWTVRSAKSADAELKLVENGRKIFVYSGSNSAEILAALEKQEESDVGPSRLVITAKDIKEWQARAGQAKKSLEAGATKFSIAPGVYYSSKAMEGELGYVFTGAAAAYAGMGRELFAGFPNLAPRLLKRYPSLKKAAHWLDPRNSELSDKPFEVLHGCSFLCQAHSELTGHFNKRSHEPDLGVSSGETNSMFDMGAWTDFEAMFQEIYDSGMYQEQIAGEFQCAVKSWQDSQITEINWACWRILASVDEVQRVVDQIPFVQLTMINTDTDCVIGGQADSCKKVIDEIGARYAFPLGHDIIAHSPEMKAWEQPWYDLHHRKTDAVEGVRFYSNALGTHYQASADRIAEALTGQALKCVDFRKVVEAAWEDGVRIFVEHGPRGSSAAWIQQILGDRPHLAVALDRPGAGVDQFIDAMAQLLAAGVPVNTDLLGSNFDKNSHTRTLRTYPAHYKAVRLPVVSENQSSIQVMAPAPTLPSVFETAAAAASPSPQTISNPVAPVIAPAHHGSMGAPPAFQTQVPSLPASGTQVAPTVKQGIGVHLVQFHQTLAAAHNQFLAMQGQVTQQLLAIRSGQSQLPGAQAPAALANYTAAPAPASMRPATKSAPVAPAPAASPEAPTQALVRPAPAQVEVVAPLEATPAVLPGPKIDREGLKVLASGKISEILGPLFKRQDDFRRQVRMPEPPLLLADRVTGIESAPGSMGKGRIWTETDVRPDCWFLHYGRMPTGIMIESGQADLLLISWLGADFENKGERVYRLLGCELTFHEGGLPAVGDTLVYDIKIDGYAQQGPIRLFFFHYDCNIENRSRLSVRHGQAGFFTDEELAASAGILWSAEDAEPDPEGVVDQPLLKTDASFSADQVRAFSEGKVVECFGSEFEMSRCHVRTPKISSGRMLLFDEVLEFNSQGGPWGRGYLKAVDHLAVDEWFFDGHFKNDPCMPGTLMFEGCVQTMSFYLAAMGVTLDRDGWLFEPVPEEAYQLRCRGQVTPGAKLLEYEVFVEEFIAGPIPVLKADLLCTVDGLKAFHCKGMKLRLRPAWPLESRPALMDTVERGPESKIARGPDIPFDYYSLAACAWGQPSHAFGAMYGMYDSERRCPRLPGPPYHFMSRITELNADPHTKKAGGTIEVEYDIPPDAWYFAENGRRVMPYCVLLEAALQPCGWMASFIGCALGIEDDVFFRNLDGTSTLFEEVYPDSGTLRTTVKSTNVSQAGPMIIVSFLVECFIETRKVYEMKTAFGFFPGEALASQVGLPATPEERSRIEEMNGRHKWLRARPAELFHSDLRLPGPMLMLLDSILEYQENGGEGGLGKAAAEIAVEMDQWFFKCHFYGDPVQPGSLGIEAMLQLFQWLMLEKKLGQDIENPRFESIQLGAPMTWKYRGQVVPTNKRVVLEIEITEQVVEADSVTVTGNASYWCDGIRIYEATNIGMRVVSGNGPTVSDCSEKLDPATDLWLGDHCPTWTAPALAMMSMVDRLAGGGKTRAPGREIRSLKNVQVSRWLSFERGPRELQVHGVPRKANEVHTELFAWDESSELFETVARGEVIVSEENQLAPKAWDKIEDGVLQDDPYESGVLFHGPRYQALKELYLGASGSSSLLDASPGEVPFGNLNQRLLDAATHGIPHDRLSLWSSEIPEDMVAYPVSIPEAHFYGPAPDSGIVRCEARFKGFKGNNRFPWISLQLIVEGEDRVWAEIELVEALFPKGPIGSAKAEHRRAFLG
ncbi:MAG: beta-ketoacyl synthase N-terminal-like domain-containing protein, partial [Planctomycetota bacterium]|nr:beta-ketoacyl synthase N-terminal-like domain-containing protein [Planctomycetota bacterium]